jgi:hypothetical protein
MPEGLEVIRGWLVKASAEDILERLERAKLDDPIFAIQPEVKKRLAELMDEPEVPGKWIGFW